MKKQFLLILILCLGFKLFADEKETEVKSTIKYVTVFKKGAQVSREATATIPKGNSLIKFVGISPSIDKNSIQVKADGNFTVMSVVHHLNYFEEPVKTEEVTKLELEQEKLQDQINVENAILKSFNEEESLILTNKSIGGQQNGLQISELRAAADFYRARITEIKLKKLEINKVIKQLKEDQQKVRKQLEELNNVEGTYTSEIVLAVSADVSTAGKFLLSYIVNNAGWVPNYDIRVKDVKSPIGLTYKGNVYQTSGEVWKEVKLTLSTGDPSKSGTKPTLYPWKLRFYVPSYANAYGQRLYEQGVYSGAYSGPVRRVEGIVLDESGEPLIGASVLVKGTTVGTVTDVDGRYSIEVPEYGQSLVISYVGYNSTETVINSNQMNIVLGEGVTLDEVVVTSGKVRGRSSIGRKQKKMEATKPVPVQEVENATSVEFQIDIPYTILTDGKQYTVEMKKHELPAYYEYYCAPKLDKDAFLTAQVTGWEDYNLLNGEANLFFEGTFLGKSLLNVQEVEDTLNLSLGRDKNIVVKRTKLKEFSKKRFLSNKKVASRAWDIEIRNKKKQAINIVIEDQFPISTEKEIEVDRGKYEGAELDNDTGILTWKFSLEPSQSKKLSFDYTVKYPRKKIVLLE